MIKGEIERIIENYIKQTSRLLPDGFETDDLLEDLRSHIDEAFSDKVKSRPSEDQLTLVREVLNELGTPEEIADQYGQEQFEELDSKTTTDKWIRNAMRLTATILVVVITSWFASVMTEGLVNFNVAVIALLFLTMLEWYVRSQQTKDA
ncbi:MAG: hypothetical protein ACFFEE_10035 [Candidatus Thorarchaeota archaeon]